MEQYSTMQAQSIDMAQFDRVREAITSVAPFCKTTAHKSAIINAVTSAKPVAKATVMPGWQVSQLQGIREGAEAIAMPGDATAITPGEVDCLAEALVGDLRVLESPTGKAVLYRRAYPRDGWASTSIPAEWQPLGTPEAFYACQATGGLKAANLTTLLTHALQAAGQVIRRGLRVDAKGGSIVCAFRDGAYRYWQKEATGEWAGFEGVGEGTDGWATGVTGAQHAVAVSDDAAFLDAPFTMTIATPLTLGEVAAKAVEAVKLSQKWADGSADSARNLRLSWAAPVMESHPEKIYWAVGQGGSGKSALYSSLTTFFHGAAGCSAEYLASPGTMGAENMMYAIQDSSCCLFDELTPNPRTWVQVWSGFKSLSTGLLPFAPRRRGEDSGKDCSTSAVVYVTSNAVAPIGEANADQRRMCAIRMTGAGFWAFKPIKDAGLIWTLVLAGAMTWVCYRGQHAASAVWVDPEALSDESVAAVSLILSCEPTKAAPEGYVRASLLPTGVRPQALGLIRKRMGLKDEQGRWQTVHCWLPAPAGSPMRSTWEATRAAVEGMNADGGAEPPTPPTPPAPPTPPSTPVEPAPTAPTGAADAVKEPHTFALPAKLEAAAEKLEAAGVKGQIIPCKGGADYAQAKRPTVSWKAAEAKAEAEPDALGVYKPVTTGAAALVLSPKQVAVDLDLPKGEDKDKPSGEKIIVTLMPEVREAARAVIRTASGGMHLIFDAPAGIELVNRAHPGAGKAIDPRLPIYKAGLPIDVRTSKGYVVMAGSEAAGKEWILVSTTATPDAPHPMPESLLKLLAEYGFVKHEPTPAERELAAYTRRAGRRDAMAGFMGESTGAPDMAPIPEGQRNQVLHDWMYGRAANYPENWGQIRSDALERGLKSGLKADEIHAITGSVARALGLEA